MNNTIQTERQTQERIIKLFQNELGYEYLGNWAERENNSNVKEELLRKWLISQLTTNHSQLIEKVIYEFTKVARDQSRSLYDVNKEVYSLLRYGVTVQHTAGQNKQTVWLID